MVAFAEELARADGGGSGTATVKLASRAGAIDRQLEVADQDRRAHDRGDAHGAGAPCRVPDIPPVSTAPPLADARRRRRWALVPSIAALAILLAIAGTLALHPQGERESAEHRAAALAGSPRPRRSRDQSDLRRGSDDRRKAHATRREDRPAERSRRRPTPVRRRARQAPRVAARSAVAKAEASPARPAVRVKARTVPATSAGQETVAAVRPRVEPAAKGSSDAPAPALPAVASADADVQEFLP